LGSTAFGATALADLVLANAVFANTVFAAAPEPAAAPAVIPDSLVIRVYDNAGLLQAERARAISRADAILSRADIDIEWIDCPAGRSGGASSICGTPPAPGELVVRIVNAPADAGSRARTQALGYSLIDTTTGLGTMATLFVDRITRLATSARTELATVLGRTLAHEIGHLILGSNEHSRTGIMREHWTAVDLVNTTARDWLFLPAQSERMRQARLLGAGLAHAGGESRLPPGG
jgi:hypothetical protein